MNFEFEPRASKYPAKTGTAASAGASKTALKTTTKTAAKSAGKTSASKAPKAPRAPAAGKAPSETLAAVIGAEPVAQAQAIQKIWAYVRSHQLQDAANKRNINADAKLLPLFGKPQITMFELAGIVSKHLG